MTNIEFDIDRLMQEWRINGFVVFEDFIPLETIDRIRQAWVSIRNNGIENKVNQEIGVGTVIMFACLLKVHLLMKTSLSIQHLLTFLNGYWDQIMFGLTLTQTFLCLTQTISIGTATANFYFQNL